LGTLELQLKNYKTAEDLLQESINLNSNNHAAYNNLGNLFKDLRKYSQAITNYNKAIEINPNYSGCLYNLAKTYAVIANYELALNFYKRSISSNANFFDAYYDYAELLEMLGKFDEALENYYKLLKLKNNYPYLKGSIVHLKLKTCQWQNLQEEIKDIENNIIKERVVNPFHVLVITDSSKLQKNGIPKGKRLITESEISTMGKQKLIDLEEITPVLHDDDNYSGSREWWLFERSPGKYGKVDINEFNTFKRCNGIPKHMMAILKDT
jgi:tetratricopeptide (TPR) repeat protein